MSEGYEGPVYRCPYCTKVYSSANAAAWCDCDDNGVESKRGRTVR